MTIMPMTMMTLFDFFEAAESLDLPYKTLLEVRKLPARLGLDDSADLVEFAADLPGFDAHVADRGDAVYAGARNPTAARQQANSRLRTALKAWHASHAATAGETVVDARADYDLLYDWVSANLRPHGSEAGLFAQGRQRTIASLRARFHDIPLPDLTAEIAGRRVAEARAEKRKSLRRMLGFVDALRLRDDLPPEIARLMPAAPLCPAKRARIDWRDLPAPLRTEVEALLARILSRPETQLAEADALLAAGADPAEVRAAINAARARESRNPTSWRKRPRTAIAWLYRAALDCGATVERVADLFAREIVEAAITDHVHEGNQGRRKRPADETQTLNGYLGSLGTVARHGLRDERACLSLELARATHKRFFNNPHIKGLSKPAQGLILDLHRGPDLMRRYVEGPALISAERDRQLARWSDLTGNQRLQVLKVAAAAAVWSLQVTRPRRSQNLIWERLQAVRDPVSRKSRHSRTLWIEDGAVRVRTPALEVKNEVDLAFSVTGDDAAPLLAWIEEYRPLYCTLRGIDADKNVYLFPGAAAPRDLPEGLDLPRGCVSVSWFADVWHIGAKIVGLGMSAHQARHAATAIWLKLHPGDYAGAAALLADAESTVRRKYGADDAAQVAGDMRAEVRAAFSSPDRPLSTSRQKGKRHGTS